MLPMIRNIMPDLIAQDLVGVQPMTGLSDLICSVCRIAFEGGSIFTLSMKYSSSGSRPPKTDCCPLCQGKLESFTVFNMSDKIYGRDVSYYKGRAKLFRTKEETIEADMNVIHTALRPFMTDDREPNVKYRPWLEEHAGKQKVDWDWDIHSMKDNTLEIRFTNQEIATLFELTWD